MKTNVAASPALKIRIKKNADGSAALTLVRPDGTTTWQKQNGKLGRFFPLHDLTHYSVETALGYTNAFYGLVASGWDIGDFTTPWPRGRVPLQGSHSKPSSAHSIWSARWVPSSPATSSTIRFGSRAISRGSSRRLL